MVASDWTMQRLSDLPDIRKPGPYGSKTLADTGQDLREQISKIRP